MSYDYLEPWDRIPPGAEAPLRGRYKMEDLDLAQPALLRVEGWHFRSWDWGRDPYFLYAPDGVLVARWETEPSYSDLYDAYRAWTAQHECP